MSTTEYSNVFEERNQASTTKLPSENELCKESIVEVALKISDNNPLIFFLLTW